MNNDDNMPKKCNNCGGTKIVHQVWGRTEYYSCQDCKKEVTASLVSWDQYWNMPTTVWYGDGNGD